MNLTRTEDSNSNTDYIDGLRGIAILFAMTVHIRHLVDEKSFSGGILHSFVLKGGIGVLIFFALSSYLNFYSTSKRNAGDSLNWKNFFIRRFFRIIPLWWLAVALYWLVLGFSAKVALTQFTFLFGFLFYDNNYFPMIFAWSLFAEIVFYLCFPIIFRNIKSLRASFYLLLSSMIGTVVYMFLFKYFQLPENNFFLFRFPLFVWHLFCLGIFLYFFLPNSERYFKKMSPWIMDVVAFISIMGWFYEKNISVLITICALMLGGHLNSSLIGFISRKEILKLFGKYCYSIYLFHALLIQFLTQGKSYYLWIFNYPGEVQFIFFFLIISVSSLILGHISYQLFEKHFLKLGQKFII